MTWLPWGGPPLFASDVFVRILSTPNQAQQASVLRALQAVVLGRARRAEMHAVRMQARRGGSFLGCLVCFLNGSPGEVGSQKKKVAIFIIPSRLQLEAQTRTRPPPTVGPNIKYVSAWDVRYTREDHVGLARILTRADRLFV